MTTNTGGPAFANVISLECVRVEMDGSAEYEPKAQPGNITVRDYFAGKALQGIAARMSKDDFDDLLNEIRGGMNEASVAFVLADAMLKARSE